MQYLKTKLANKMWMWLGLAITSLLLLAWFYGPDVAHAAPTTPPPGGGAGGAGAAGAGAAAGGGTADQLGNAAYANFLQIVLLLQELLNKILWPILFMIGGLMDNDLIFNHGMETRLFAIWVQIRNIVNILFVVALVGLALYNVLGIGGEGDQFSLKAVLPKLIVGIIAVNFSYIGIKILLDAINLGTTAIFGLPEAVEQGLSVNYKDENEKALYQKVICENLYGPGGPNLKDEKVVKVLQQNNISTENITVTTPNYPFICVGVKLHQSAEKFFQRFGVKNAAMVLAVNMGKIAFFDKAAVQSAGSFAKLSLNVLFSIVLYFVYVFSFVALFIILIARLIVMWLGVALSPFLMLSTALPGGLKEKLSVIEKIKFVKHAFVPLEIAFPMSVGFMMLQAFQGISFGGSSDFSTAILTTGTLNIGVATSGLSTLQDLLIAIATIGVVWKGVFDAAEGTLAEKVVGTIREAGESIGGFVAAAPFKYIPWVPVRTGEAGSVDLTPSAIIDTLKDVPGRLEQEHRNKAGKALFPELFRNGTSNPRAFDDVTNAEGLKGALRQNLYQLEKGDTETGQNLLKFAKNTAVSNPVLAELNSTNPEAATLLKQIREAGSPEEAAKLGHKLAKELRLDQPVSPPGGPSTPSVPQAGAATAGAARMKEMVNGVGSPAKLREQIPNLPAELRDDAEKIAKAVEDNNDAELERLAADPKAAQITAYVHSDTKMALEEVDRMTAAPSEEQREEIAERIRTAKAKLNQNNSNMEAAKAAEDLVLKRVEEKLSDRTPEEREAIMQDIRTRVTNPRSSTSASEGDEEGT